MPSYPSNRGGDEPGGHAGTAGNARPLGATGAAPGQTAPTPSVAKGVSVPACRSTRSGFVAVLTIVRASPLVGLILDSSFDIVALKDMPAGNAAIAVTRASASPVAMLSDTG